MHRTSRYANLLMDVVSRMTAAPTADARWSVISDIVGGLGANGVAGGEVSIETRHPIWSVYNLEQSLLQEYDEARFYEVDPILSALMLGNVPKVMSPRATAHGVIQDARAAQFDAAMARHNYNYCICFTRQTGGVERSMTLTTDADPTDLFGPGTYRAFGAISSVMMSYLERSDDVRRPSIRSWEEDQLSGPERDILSLMAHGLSQDDISARMKVSTQMVQTFLNQSIRKLNASDGDHAMVTAMSRGMLSL